MKLAFQAILVLACCLLTVAKAAEPVGPETFSKRAVSPPPPDPLFQEGSSPPVKLGVGWSGTTNVSSGFALGWANASVDFSRVEIHAADPGPWTHLVARQLATTGPAETVTCWGALTSPMPCISPAWEVPARRRSSFCIGGCWEAFWASGHAPERLRCLPNS